MIRKSYFLLPLILILVSCGSSKKISEAPTQSSVKKENNVASAQAISKNEDYEVFPDPPYSAIIEAAKDYMGTRYKYGGTSKKGMDCSGLVYTAFLEEDIPLPRTSRAMSLEGDRIDLEEVQIGDLLFFETDKNKKVINHVGLVVEVRQEDISFIHSTTSRGVIISSLAESYWHAHFVMARRIN